MPCYRVHRMKEGPREAFRWAAHTGGLAIAKPKDYEPGEELDAQNPYEGWKHLAAENRPLRPGDLLEAMEQPAEPSASGTMWIAKYVGFEPAQWYVPASVPAAVSSSQEGVNASSTDSPMNAIPSNPAL